MFRLQKEERATTDGMVSEDPFSTGTLKRKSLSLMSLLNSIKWISLIREERDFKLPSENVLRVTTHAELKNQPLAMCSEIYLMIWIHRIYL